MCISKLQAGAGKRMYFGRVIVIVIISGTTALSNSVPFFPVLSFYLPIPGRQASVFVSPGTEWPSFTAGCIRIAIFYLYYPSKWGKNFWTYIRECSRNNQHYAPICTTPLFYIPAPTYFSSSQPSSGSFLDPSELLEIQIDWEVYHNNVWLRGLCAGLSWSRRTHDTQTDLRSSLMMAGYCRNM
jgi:hypothetical protein